MRHSAIRTNYNITTISALIQPEHSYVCTESIALHTVRLQASLRLNVMSLGSIRSLVSIVYCPIAFSHLLTSFILMCLCIRGTEKRLSFIPIVLSSHFTCFPAHSSRNSHLAPSGPSALSSRALWSSAPSVPLTLQLNYLQIIALAIFYQRTAILLRHCAHLMSVLVCSYRQHPFPVLLLVSGSPHVPIFNPILSIQ